MGKPHASPTPDASSRESYGRWRWRYLNPLETGSPSAASQGFESPLAHLSGPCLRFRKGCFPLPACQLPIGSSPGTSLSANSSIMFALVQLDCVDTAPMDACFAGAPVAVHRLCGGNEGTQSTAPQAPDRPRPHTAALGNL
jgi:hypothetical protein